MAVNAVTEVRQAIMKLTSNPAEFDEVMLALVSLLTDSLHDKSIVEAVVEDIFIQVCLCVTFCVRNFTFCLLLNTV